MSLEGGVVDSLRIDLNIMNKPSTSPYLELALKDPVELMIRLSCILCYSSTNRLNASSEDVFRFINYLLLDLYSAVSVYSDIIIEDRRVGRGICPIVRGICCSSVELVNNNGLKLDVKCSNLEYSCTMKHD
jgi:hypothetical protein